MTSKATNAPKPDALFQLINRLTPSEKRYFLSFHARNRHQKAQVFVQLFMAMHELNTYSHEGLVKAYLPEILPTNLPSEKAHLKRKLLEALRSYHESRNHKQLIRNLLQESEILLEKGLYQDSLKQVRKARKKAEK